VLTPPSYEREASSVRARLTHRHDSPRRAAPFTARDRTRSAGRIFNSQVTDAMTPTDDRQRLTSHAPARHACSRVPDGDGARLPTCTADGQ
jgi:hypothetical protein